jgi:Domain of unknown function DUF1828
MNTACETIEQHVGALFSCTTINERTRIRTPFLYPDGDLVDLFLQDQGAVMVLSDLGETLRWLRMQTVAQRKSKKQRQLITDVVQTCGIQEFKGSLFVRLDSLDQLAEASVRLGQAAMRVADLWFTLRNQAFESIADEVEAYLIDEKVRYERSIKLIGRSTRQWTIDFQTATAKRTCLISVLSTGTRGATRQLTNNTMAAWVDLSQYQGMTPPHRFVSLFDDTVDIWDEDDFKLLEDYSEIVRWSDPSELLIKISA